MKIKNVLVWAFLGLTLIPIVIVSLLLYKSGYELSKESYMRNLAESISVQSDYMTQTISNDMIEDYRFAYRSAGVTEGDEKAQEDALYTAFQSYLGTAEDKITVCMLLDKDNFPVYTIGESAVIETVRASLPPPSQLDRQSIVEFELKPNEYSLGVVTPILDSSSAYSGCLISVYDQAYLFKIISSYYKIVDTSTYLCRESGAIISSRALSDSSQNKAIEEALIHLTFDAEGVIDSPSRNMPISGYYKNISYSPWYLVGFIDDKLVGEFTNQYVFTYILIIAVVIIIDILLALYFSNKVVEPINSLIRVMEGYPDTLSSDALKLSENNSYYETKYLRTKFLELMKRILLVQHNFAGVYQLYQSGNMSDTNINIDTGEQTITSNKEMFQVLMNQLEVAPEACIVESFINCFCEKDQRVLMGIFENMRDRHLSVPCEVEVYTPHFDEKWFHTLVVPMYENDRLSHLFIQLRDVSSFKKQELESNEKARRDSLTGLYNRSGFTMHVSEVLESSGDATLHGFLFLDMDYFKMVNDNLGHSAGDDLLCSVGTILLEIIGTNGVVSRFGGDEFAVFLPNVSLEAIDIAKESLHRRLIYPFTTEQVSFTVTASIGVAIWDSESPDTLEALLQQADADMYQAKKRFKQE